MMNEQEERRAEKKRYYQNNALDRWVEKAGHYILTNSLVACRLMMTGDLKTLSRSYNYRNRFSLPQGSIIANPLFVTDPEKGVVRHDSSAGMFSSARFTPEFGTETNMKLGGFRLDDYLEEPPDALTPTLPYNPTNVENILDTDRSAFPILLEHEFIVKKSLSEAYHYAFPDNQDIQDTLNEFGVSDKPCYQVTPKGNSLVLLFRSSGNKKAKPKEHFSNSPIPIK